MSREDSTWASRWFARWREILIPVAAVASDRLLGLSGVSQVFVYSVAGFYILTNTGTETVLRLIEGGVGRIRAGVTSKAHFTVEASEFNDKAQLRSKRQPDLLPSVPEEEDDDAESSDDAGS